MGLLALLRKLWHGDGGGEARVLLLGLDNAGKTTLLLRLSADDDADAAAPTTSSTSSASTSASARQQHPSPLPLATVAPTHGFTVKALVTRGGARLHVWDVGGQRALRPYWRNYFDAADGAVFVVDAADRRRLPEAAAELAALLEDDKLRGVPLLVLANKQDLLAALPASALADALRLFLLRDRPWRLAGCSARDGSGVADNLEWLVRAARGAGGGGGGGWGSGGGGGGGWSIAAVR